MEISNNLNEYDSSNIPSFITNSIYLYASNDIKDIKLYGDKNGDGSIGFIITDKYFYYNFNHPGKIELDKIQSITFKTGHNIQCMLTVKCNDVNHIFNDDYLSAEAFGMYLKDELEILLNYDMNNFDKIYYFSKLVLTDIKNDEYEDLELTDIQQKQLDEYLDSLEAINLMNDQNYQIEVDLIADKLLTFIFDLELDSDDIDELESAISVLHRQEDQMKTQVDDMIKNNKDNIKNMTGIDIDDIANKSPEELNNMLDNLCEQFNISKDQLSKLASKFTK